MSNHSDLLVRVAAMQEEAYSGSNAYPYFYILPENEPYWVNRLGPASYSWDSEDIGDVSRSIIMRLVIAKLTEGYTGEPETLLMDKLDAIILFFMERLDLTSSLYPAPPTYLYSTETELRTDGGLVFWQNGQNQPTLLGVEFTLAVQYRVDVT